MHLDTSAYSISPSRPFYLRFGKRALDIAVALTLLPVIGVVLTVIYVALGLGQTGRGQGAFFFAHTRVGQNGETFKCWKIRTMVQDAQARLEAHLAANPEAAAEWARTQKLGNDPRITRLGAFLRRTSLDELPQIWNVLRGDMSLVGPRPVTADELDRYGALRQTYLALKPGVTGFWQIHGRSNGCYDERLAMDHHYASHISFWRDMILIGATVSVVIWPTGR